MMSTAAANLPTIGNRPFVSRAGWVWIAVVATLFLAFHWTFVNRMILIATSTPGGKNPWEMLVHIIKHRWNPDWSHVLAIPFISLYFVVRSRDVLARTPRCICTSGLVLLFMGMLSFLWWIEPGRNDMFQGLSMIIALFGLGLFLLGPAMMRILWFPIAYLIFFIKVSDRIWDRVAFGLQRIAAEAATGVLNVLTLFMDFDVYKTGNRIEVGYSEGGQYLTQGLEIAQACSGLRMLMAFVALGVAMAYLADRAPWQRLIMVLMAVPVAVMVNVGRVVMLALLTMVNEEMTKGDFHTFLGMLMLIPAAGLFWLVGWVVDRLVLNDPEGQPSSAGPPNAALEAKRIGETQQAAPSGTKPIYAITGLMVGFVLAVLVGLNYWLLWIAIKPWIAANPFAGNSSQVTSILMLAGGVALLGVAGVCFRRLLIKHTLASEPQGATTPTAPAFTMAHGLVVGVLLTTVFGFQLVKKINGVVLIKEPVELRQPLFRLRQDFGSWQWINEDPPLPPDEVEVLGTSQYVSYHYRDRSRGEGASAPTVRLHVAYYTGTVDTVPHVPDRCYLAAGALQEGQSSIDLNVGGLQYRGADPGFVATCRLDPDGVYLPDEKFLATQFRYRNAADPGHVHAAVYFFVANGAFLATPDRVRFRGFNPRDRFSYYCKVEVGLSDIGDDEEAANRASQFLSTMLPEILACLPDWRQMGQITEDLGRHNQAMSN